MPTEEINKVVERIAKRLCYEKLVSESSCSQEVKNELLEKDEKHIDSVLKALNIKINNQLLNIKIHNQL